MIAGLLRHVEHCRTVRRLLDEHPSENLASLSWYDMPLARAVTWEGMREIGSWNLSRRRDDEIAGNYDIVNLYWAPPDGDGLDRPAPTVWRCGALEGVAWHDEPLAIRDALEANAPAIIAEYHAAAHRILTHPDNASLTDRGRWTGMFLYQAKGVRNDELAALCPVTTRVVEASALCRSFGFAMFSGLEPGTHIQPHTGSTNLRLRVHLGISVPEPEAARLRVGTEWRHWREGRTLAFDDAFQHEVIHDGARERVVLVVDQWHPGLSASDVAVLSHPVFQSFGRGRPRAQVARAAAPGQAPADADAGGAPPRVRIA